MKIEILSVAETEFTETVNYYNNQSEGVPYRIVIIIITELKLSDFHVSS